MLTPQQLLEKMLESVAKFDGAQVADSLDRAILRAEANSLFRILRVIEESSGQRFIVTAKGSYLDLIGQGMSRPRYTGESDEDYRSRLVFNEQFWNDTTVAGIKEMIRSYYGIDLDGDEFEETRLIELYRQAASFLSNEPDCEVKPWSDFGASWLGEDTKPGAFEVHLKCFQEGEERLIKKRHVKEKLMAVRAAGIVVLLYFHINFGPDVMQPMDAGLSELELIQQEPVVRPQVEQESFELEIRNSEITGIIATAKDELKGLITRRVVHVEQKNKCRDDYLEEMQRPMTTLQMAKMNSETVRRAEPFRFRQSRLRNSCWSFYYGVKYEEMDITAAALTISLAWNKPATFFPVTYKVYYDEGNGQYDGIGLKLNGERMDSPFVVTASTLADPMQPSLILNNASLAGSYSFRIAAIMPNGDELAPLNSAYATYNEGVHTYYTRPNPMVDAVHHYRGEDVYGVDFYSILEYCNFWWRVSTVENGTVQTASLPWKLTLYKTVEQATRFWWRVSTIDGQTISAPSKAELLKIMGTSTLPQPLRHNLMQTVNWKAQSKNISFAQLSLTNNEVLMLERFNPLGQEWARFDVIALKTSRTPSRVILAKLPVCGAVSNDPFLQLLEIEDKGMPSAGYVPFNYMRDEVRVKYWQMLDKIAKQGVDGVLLDGLWLSSVFGDESAVMSFVEEIINYFRRIKSLPMFYIVLRGTEHWVSNNSIFTAVNGIISENVFYAGDVLQDTAVTVDRLSFLNQFHTSGKEVFVIDYISDAATIVLFKQKCEALGFAGFTTNQDWSN
jgi:endo-alpha-1,4-polygalactosaminidase (GH114 family)